MTEVAEAQICRVGLVHWAFPPTTGGVESHLHDLASVLADRGHAVTVITGETDPDPVADVEIISTPLLDLERVREGKLAGSEYRNTLYSILCEIITGRELQVVHGHNLHHFAPEPALALNQLRKQLGFRMHHTFHETWPGALHDRPVYREWDDNYAVSGFVQDECARRLGFRPRLLPLCIDVDRFQATRPAFEGSRTPVILHPARLLPWKGVHLSVQMLARLRDRGLHTRLVITDTQRISDWNQELGDYRRQVSELIAALGAEDMVTFRSAGYPDMPALYADADVVVYPTVGNEPFGLVPLEAMSCARPVVASLSGGIAETIVHEVTGFVFEPGDVDAFADLVTRVVADPKLARELGLPDGAMSLKTFICKGMPTS